MSQSLNSRVAAVQAIEQPWDGTGMTTPTGPIGPQAGVAAPAGPALPTRRLDVVADVYVVGAHGGAGESTVAALNPAWWAETGHGWPLVSTSPSPRVLLVARTSASGLRAAQAAATQWAAGAAPPMTLLGLVLVADAPGRLPRALRELVRLVSGGVPRTWMLPWNEPWRLGEEITVRGRRQPAAVLVRDVRLLSEPKPHLDGKEPLE